MTVTKKQAVCMMSLFIVSGIPVLTGYTVAERNVWLAYLIAFVAAIPLYFICARLSEIYPDRNLYEMLADVFGKTFGRIFSVLYVLYFTNIAAMSVRNVAEFAGTVSLDRTSRLFIVFICAFVCFYVASRGIRSIAKFSVLFFPTLIISLVFFFICSVGIYNVGNLEPFTVDSYPALLKNSYSCFVFPIAEAPLLIGVMPYVRRKKGEMKKIYLISLLISAAVILSVSVSNVLALGVPTMIRLYYPTYAAVSLIEIGVVRRLEIVASVLFFTAGILKGALSVFVVSEGFGKKRKNTAVLLFISAAVALIAEFLYPSIIELVGFLEVYANYAVFLQLFPAVLWMFAEIKLKKGRNKISVETDNTK